MVTQLAPPSNETRCHYEPNWTGERKNKEMKNNKAFALQKDIGSVQEPVQFRKS